MPVTIATMDILGVEAVEDGCNVTLEDEDGTLKDLIFPQALIAQLFPEDVPSTPAAAEEAIINALPLTCQVTFSGNQAIDADIRNAQ